MEVVISQAGTIDIEAANPQVPTNFVADTGSAVPIANTLEILGGVGIDTSASGNTVTISLSGGGEAIDTINGDSGFISGNDVTIRSGTATLNSGSTVNFTNSGTLSTFNVTDSVRRNTIVGRGSGNATITGSDNTGFGNLCLTTLSSGASNTAFGAEALKFNSTSHLNTAVGWSCMSSNSPGSNNTAIGALALTSLNFSGSNNICVGQQAGVSLATTESSNILIGSTGTPADANRIRIGTQGAGAGQQNTCFIAGITGVTTTNTQMVTINTSTGQLGAAALGTGSITTIAGDSGSITGSSVTIFANNAALNSGSTVKFDNTGTVSTFNVTDALHNTLIGLNSGKASITGQKNVGLGELSLHSLTSGNRNIGIGYSALTATTAASDNIAIGDSSLILNVNGGGNIAIGTQALSSISTNFDVSNIAIGNLTLWKQDGGGSNTSIGYQSSINVTSGVANTALGMGALANITTGYLNIAIGSSAGQNLTLNDNNNIIIGVDGTAGDVSTLRIGNLLTSCYISGISGVTTSNSEMVTIDTMTGQLGSVTIPSAAYSLTPYIVGLAGDTNAQYTGDTGIQDAINQAVIDGASASNPLNIYIKPGTYTPTANTLDLADGINLIAFGEVLPNGIVSNTYSQVKSVNVLGKLNVPGICTAQNINFSVDAQTLITFNGNTAYLTLIDCRCVWSDTTSGGIGIGLANAGENAVLNLYNTIFSSSLGNTADPIFTTASLGASSGLNIYLQNSKLEGGSSSHATCDTQTINILSNNSYVFPFIDFTSFGSLTYQSYYSRDFTSGMTFVGALIPPVFDIRYSVQGNSFHAVNLLSASATYQAELNDDLIGIDTSMATTVTLYPYAFLGQTVTVKDATGTAASFNITVDGGAYNIDGAGTFVISGNWNSATFVFDGAKWLVI